MTKPKHRLNAAVDRILRTWSLIKMVPERELSTLRPSLLQRLAEQHHLSEDELVVVGLKYLHQQGPTAP